MLLEWMEQQEKWQEELAQELKERLRRPNTAS